MHDESEKTVEGDPRGGEIAPAVGLRSLGTTLLTAAFNLKFFTSRSERVQRFIREDAFRYMQKRYANVFVWPHPDDATRILGFYTLSPCSIERAEMANRFQRRSVSIEGIPVPMALIGYMGKAQDAPKGFGATLVYDAALRLSQPQDLPVWGIALHPENEELAKWYDSLNFERGRVWQKDRTHRLVMYAPLVTLLPKAG